MRLNKREIDFPFVQIKLIWNKTKHKWDRLKRTRVIFLCNYEWKIDLTKGEWNVWMILEESLSVLLRSKEDDCVYFQIRKCYKISGTIKIKIDLKLSGMKGVHIWWLLSLTL